MPQINGTALETMGQDTWPRPTRRLTTVAVSMRCPVPKRERSQENDFHKIGRTAEGGNL